MKPSAALLCIFLLCAAVPVFSQAASPPAGNVPAGDASGAGTEKVETPAEKMRVLRGSALLRDVLPMDIRTSSFTELAAWCKRLGLPADGDRASLERRIYEYYGLDVPKKEEQGAGGNEIKIESAQKTEYFSLDDFKEDYVRLDGGVSMRIVDSQKGHTYTITANSIIYNQNRKLLNAVGDVAYSITGEGRDEVFTGESITLNIDSWEGYFFEGTTFRERTVEEKPLTFRIRGEFVSRSTTDFVVMENARITSSPRLPPNYEIRADKIWILGPGDWGLSGATLHVGNIPVFYFPFFFYPGDEVVFHPVFGTRSREGTFMQTTTYFLGNRKNEEFPFAFLQLTDDEENNKVKERHGIFLRDTDVKLENTDRYVKLIFDAYTNLGFFTGIGIELSGMNPVLKTLKLDSGLALSRNLYRDTVPGYMGAYTPHFQETDGSLSMHWNRARLGDFDFPFRFANTAKLSLDLGKLSLNFLFEEYSDAYFDEDFYQYRAEQIDWSKFMRTIEEEKNLPIKERLNWQIDGSFSPDVSFLSPYVSNFSISRFTALMDLRSKDTNSSRLEPYAQNVDPTRRFFYPDTLTAPEISFQMGGTLLSSDRKAASSPGADAKKDEKFSLRVPWEEDEEKKAEAAKEEEDLKLPELRKDITVSLFPAPFGYSIRYSFSPRLVYQRYTNSRGWDAPEDAEFDFAYRTTTIQNTSQLFYDFLFYDNLFQTKGGVSHALQYQDVSFYDDTITQAERENLLVQAYRYNTQNLTNNVTFSTFPFAHTDMFKSTNFQYNQQILMYRRAFDPAGYTAFGEPVYKDSYFRANREYITANTVSFGSSVDTLPFTPRVQLSYVLPPLEKVFTSTSTLITGPLTSTATFQTRNVNDRWVNQPVSFDEYLKLSDRVSLRGTYLYDYVESTPYSFTGTAQLWFFSGTFLARYTEPYDFDPLIHDWVVRGTEKKFMPANMSLGLDYSVVSEPMWKNRIRFSLALKSSWTIDLIRRTESSLNFGYTFTFSVFRMLDLKFSAQSSNTMMYTYFPGYAQEVGVEKRNPFVDLAKSFNFFNSDYRYESYFKVASVIVEIVHHLDDWDLSFSYTGKPQLVTFNNGERRFTWDSVVGIYLRWVPIPQIKSEFEY
ncbi:MAG: hypothetical protein LBC67_08060 [Spirochaetales bacterium]|nr:hypothetical protein [Spirochaetales bacterium]